MLRVHTANRLENLTSLLLQQVAAEQQRLADPFVATEVLVPSSALRRHVTLALADQHGVCAQVRFGFLAQWLWQQVARVVPAVAQRSPFSPDALAWRIHQALADSTWLGRHPRLQAYLAQGDELMRFELATRLAGLFDQYITFRGDWLADWQAQPQAPRLPVPGQATASAAPDAADTAWQAELWALLTAQVGADALHPTSTFLDTLASGGVAAAQAAGLPAAVHLFALPSLPPLYLRLLQAVGAVAEVHVYALNPCSIYWYDLVDKPRFVRQALRGQAEHLVLGHPLLTAWGTQAQGQLKALLDATGGSFDTEATTMPDTTRLLGVLQASVLQGFDLDAGSAPLAADDRSFELHVCHSLARELEVLQDHLLALFARQPALDPGRVVVLLPDLETAAPLIDAIFGSAPRERRLPFAITGRGRSQANQPARLLLTALGLVASRCAATAVFELLQQPLVARRFGLDEAALARLHGWLLSAGFHAGLDAEHLAAQGLPALERHTLRAALARLFLGHALPAPPHEGELAAGLAGWLPTGDAEGQGALALGALWRFVETLQALQQRLRQPKTPQAWLAAMRQALDDLLAPASEDLDDLAELQTSLLAVHDAMLRGGLETEAVPLAVYHSALQAALDDPARGGVPTGSITFAALSSLRGLPCEVLCVLGLNDGAFPNSPRPAEFDLMARHPRAGDRDRRADDRGLLLDLLLSARHSVYLSHTGRSVRDNAPLPPSVLVAELLEWLLDVATPAGASAEQRSAVRAQLVVEHPLQPFALQAFSTDSEPRLRSHHTGYAQALRLAAEAASSTAGSAAPAAPVTANAEDTGEDELQDDDQAAAAAALAARPPFFLQPLDPPGPDFQRPTLAQWVRFFQHPSRGLLRQRLGLVLPRAEDQLSDDEAFVPGWPERQALQDRLLPALAAGASDDQALALAAMGTEMPDGALGRLRVQQALPALRDFVQTQAALCSPEPLPPLNLDLPFQLDGETWVLQAALTGLRPGGLVHSRPGPVGAGDLLNAWLHHLVLCAARPTGVLPVSVHLGLGGAEPLLRFAPVAEPLPLLQALMRLYRRGLTAPLHFFPKSAWALAQPGGKLSKALAVWQGGGFSGARAEVQDPAHDLLLRGQPDPYLAGEAAALATEVFAPLVAALQAANGADDPEGAGA